MKDPRIEPGFIPRRFPRCDGKPFDAVSGADGLHQVKAQFLAAYYRINGAYARRVALRQHARPRPEAERSVLQAIERAIRAKEALEDRYASRGIVATPVYQRGYTVDVRFQHPRALPIRLMAAVSSSSRTLVFALPAGLRIKRRK